MNKSDVIDEMAAITGMTKVDISKCLDAFCKVIIGGLKENKDIRLIDLFTVSVKYRPESTGKNPRDGSAITIPAANVPKFKATKKLKDALNE